VARFTHLLAALALSASGGYLSPERFVEVSEVKVWPCYVRRTDKGRVATDLTLSEADIVVKYNVHLRRDKVELEFVSTDWNSMELAARLLKLASVQKWGCERWRYVA
jgi:hypothetical protein